MNDFGAPSTYLALGDSAGVGVGAVDGRGYPGHVVEQLAAAGISLRLELLAQSGATTRDVVRAQLPRLPKVAPKLVTLGIGTNDLWRMVPLPEIVESLRTIGKALALLRAPVLVSNVIDLSLAPVRVMVERIMHVPMDAFHTRLDGINGALSTMCTQHGFRLVDLHGFSRRELPSHPEYFSADGFHPSTAGYRAWARLVTDAAREVTGVST